ncbi:MAG TPA: glutamate racemase [Candidatus Limiplasma sp.]|nr:glutamate racemase [Candidatus Limiplasma sp.]HRX07885.1 glutamate racemase [Candidatus Limiplasma sp.]
MDNRPIGVFDSGFGGVSVLAAAASALPEERFIYLGDNLHAPYGEHTEAEILTYSRACVRYLIASDCKAIVIACNTATSVAAAALRKEITLPIVAMEPALKPASMVEGDGQVLVLATEVTLKLDKFKKLMDIYGKDAVPIPAPRLVTAIEAGDWEGEKVNALLKDYLAPYLDKPVKAIVLGCTHFVFLKRALQSFLPEHIQLIDGNAGTARQLKTRLLQEKLSGGVEEPDIMARVAFHSTKTGAKTLRMMRTLFDLALAQLFEA